MEMLGGFRILYHDFLAKDMLSFQFYLDFAYFSSILVLSRERQLGKENTYEKVNHHHPRTNYDAL